MARGLISLGNDNHVANNLKVILEYVCSGSIVNSRSKNRSMFIYTMANNLVKLRKSKRLP